MVRKCAACPEPIEIDKEHTSNIVFYKKKYYHSKCFCDLATKRSQSKIKTASEWKDALDNLWGLEADTKKILESAWAKDDLNEWLLANYDIAAVPTRFWQMVADLERGVYKGKKCKSISMDTLLGAWKWGQKKLDSIARNNKANHKGPQNDETRLVYDLAILVQKIPSYLAYKEKQKATAIELTRNASHNEVDMSRIGQQKKEIKKDISDIFNDLYIE